MVQPQSHPEHELMKVLHGDANTKLPKISGWRVFGEDLLQTCLISCLICMIFSQPSNEAGDLNIFSEVPLSVHILT